MQNTMMEGGGGVKIWRKVKEKGDKLHKKWGKGLKIASFWGYNLYNFSREEGWG